MNGPVLPVLLAGLGLILFAFAAAPAGRRGVERRLRRLVTRQDGPDAAGAGGRRLPPALEGWAHRAGVPAGALLPAALVSALVAGLIGLALLGPLLAPLVALLGPGLPALFLQARAERRRRAIGEALPGFLDRMRQQLTVGASAQQALERSVAGSGAILQRVFAPALRRLRHGDTLNETLGWLAERERSAELGAFSAAIAASSRFGGRLAEALGNLARTQRDRQRVEREMKAATAEVRASAFVLALLPLGVAAAMVLISPVFLDHFRPGGRGGWLLPWLAGAYLVGILLMRRIARPNF